MPMLELARFTGGRVMESETLADTVPAASLH
jgi:hypothetical protein